MQYYFSLFRGITLPFFPYLAARAAGLAHEAILLPRTALRLYGVTEISPLRGEPIFCDSQKYGAIPKSHAALRFLPLRNCVVSSVKKRELSEALQTECAVQVFAF